MRRWLPFLLLLSACSLHPPQSVSPPELPETYQSSLGNVVVPFPERWWQSFADARLNLLQERLFAANLDLRQALHRLQQLEALQKASAAGHQPTLGLNGSVSRDHNPAVVGSSEGTNGRISLAAGYELDLWRKLADRDQAAQLRLVAGRREVQALQLSLSAQLADQYFLAAEQRGQLRLGERQLEHYHSLLANLEQRYQVGLASASELYQARQNLLLAQARLPLYRTGLVRAENSLALLLGQLPRPALADAEPLPRLETLVDAGLPASLLRRRPDIDAALLQLRASDRDLAAALAEKLPVVNLTASLGHSVSEMANGRLEGGFWSLALGLAQPLYDGGRRQAEVDRQQAIKDERLAAYRQSILRAVQEVETALTADQQSAERQQYLEQQRQAANQELFLARDNYRAGLIDSSSLFASELRFLDVSSQMLANQRQWLSNRVGLARALGGSWMAAELDQQMESLHSPQDQP